MARTQGAKSSSPSNRKKSLRKEPSPGFAPEPSPSRPIPPPVKPAPPKPLARRYLTRSGGRPLQKKPRVESSEPIDLTEQSPEPSPIPSPVQTPVPSPVPSPSPLPVPSPVPLQCHGMPCHLRHSLNAVRPPEIHRLHSLSDQQQVKVDFILFGHPMYASDHT
ncbi:vegetative cell wall protein gp1-like [Vitis vinifera]|uniref:vegetative cell wall protein gp1-like n=1 Tax=Vitis vinifera TaxID=29760 RepID=UPI00053FF022|nr:vegetative cell wall protein gp1-like [Vitis vinifera]|eukprot:XP_010644829.1 PREDICTED: vegetative cell wall protein gp1-like [Vitis vinifera]